MFEAHLRKAFTVNVEKYVGFEIEKSKKFVKLNAKGYIEACLKRFGLQELKESDNPCLKGVEESLADSKSYTNQTKYLQMLGCLSFITHLCRPDNAYSTNYLARACTNDKQVHYTLLKILKTEA